MPNLSGAGAKFLKFMDNSLFGVTNTFSGANIEFEVDGEDFGIEVTIPAPSGDEVASFYLSRKQLLIVKKLIEEALENIKK